MTGPDQSRTGTLVSGSVRDHAYLTSATSVASLLDLLQGVGDRDLDRVHHDLDQICADTGLSGLTGHIHAATGKSSDRYRAQSLVTTGREGDS